MAKKIVDYLPVRKEKKLMQARVDVVLYDEVEKILNHKNIQWVEFFEAMCKKFIDETKGR